MPRKAEDKKALSAADHADEDRMFKAWDLRVEGKTYREIADELGCGTTTAFRYCQRVLARHRKETHEKAEQHIQLQLQRLDLLLRSALPAARSGDARSIDTILRIEERKAKLLGLDKPTKADHGVSITLADLLGAADAADEGGDEVAG